MATLAKTSYPGDWEFKRSEDFKVHIERIDALYAAIPSDKIIQFPMADGYACYFVKSEKPLVLQHIPYGDAYQIDYATIRGLRLADVKARLNQVAALRKLFGSR